MGCNFTMRPATYLLDVDGCIIRHHNGGSALQWEFMSILPGVRDWFNAREKEGAKIVLVTARPECLRRELEKWLRGNGLWWHAIVMSCNSGDRIMINDKGKYKSECIIIERNGNLPSCGSSDSNGQQASPTDEGQEKNSDRVGGPVFG